LARQRCAYGIRPSSTRQKLAAPGTRPPIATFKPRKSSIGPWGNCNVAVLGSSPHLQRPEGAATAGFHVNNQHACFQLRTAQHPAGLMLNYISARAWLSTAAAARLHGSTNDCRGAARPCRGWCRASALWRSTTRRPRTDAKPSYALNGSRNRASVKIPRFPDWQTPGLWGIIDNVTSCQARRLL
jgi:hypothetical protein